MDFKLDWLCLYIQLIILITIPLREFLRKERRNIYAILIPVTMIFLVQGQTWWMLNKFEADGLTEIQHLYQDISIEGFRLANFYICLSIISLGITYGFFSLRKDDIPYDSFQLLRTPEKLSLRHILLTVLVLAFCFIIINISGGLETAVTNPGLTLEHGLVLFLMLLWLGKLPVLDNIANGRRNNWLEIMLFILVVLVFLFNSRFLASFLLLQLILLYNYCRQEIQRKTFFEAGIVFFLIFFFFGIYRHYITQYEVIQQDLSFGFILDLFSGRNLLDWFYNLNVEGFAGLAGLLTYAANQGGIYHDFGLSNLSALFQFIPSSLRFSENLLFNDMKEFFSAMYPYTGSVVPSGVENAYAHFGLIGLISLGVLLGFLMHWLHKRMLNPKNDRLITAIISVQSLQLIRGSFYLMIFLIFSELIILLAYSLIGSISRIIDIGVAPPMAARRLESRE